MTRTAALDLTFIGTGNAFAPPGRYWSSFLVNNRYLFDAPPTLLAHLKRLEVDPNDVEVVFISHFHGDHYFGLPFLLLEYAELNRRSKDLTIVGPPGVAKRVRSATELAFANVFRKDRGYDLRFVEVEDGTCGEASGARFLARQVPHVPELDCYAFRVAFDDRSISYSGDTKMTEALVPLAEGTDAFIVECSCWGDECGPHLNPGNILDLRRRISADTRFILTHIGPGQAPKAITDAGILVAEDLQTLNL